MLKRFTALLLLVLLLTGCGASAKPQGIYYPALSSRFLGESLIPNKHTIVCYADVSYLYYNENLYTRAYKYMEYNKNDLPLSELLGDELCTVYGNQTLYWSDTAEKLAEFTATGTLYQLNTYDEDFRVCLYFEEPANVNVGLGATYYLYVFERTNNITLHTGEDYYTDLFRIPEEISFLNLDTNDEEVKTFLTDLLKAELIDPESEHLPDFSADDGYPVNFTDSLGLTDTFLVYEDGYVVDMEDYRFITQLDPALCKSIIDKIHAPEWAGSYLYNTYTFDNTRNIRTQYYYQLDITETDTELTFDLLVEERHVPLAEGAIDVTIYGGPSFTATLSKEELGQKHSLSFSVQPHPESVPEYIVYVELKKGTGEDVLYLRYADSEEALEKEKYVVLNRQ